MKNIEDKIKIVLALFDEEDIPYIKSQILLDYYEKNKIEYQTEKPKALIKHRGDEYVSRQS